METILLILGIITVSYAIGYGISCLADACINRRNNSGSWFSGWSFRPLVAPRYAPFVVRRSSTPPPPCVIINEPGASAPPLIFVDRPRPSAPSIVIEHAPVFAAPGSMYHGAIANVVEQQAIPRRIEPSETNASTFVVRSADRPMHRSVDSRSGFPIPNASIFRGSSQVTSGSGMRLQGGESGVHTRHRL